MSDWQGCLRKMHAELAETVRYTVFPEQGGLCLNDQLGHSLRLAFTVSYTHLTLPTILRV